MVQFDCEAAASYHALPESEKEKHFVEDVVRLLHAHAPTPIYTGDLLNIYNRYYRHGRVDKQFGAFQNFMMRARFSRYFEVSYVEDMPFRVTLRKTRHVQKILGLPPCMQTIKRCMMTDCMHSKDCPVYLCTMSQLRNEPRREECRDLMRRV